ncbi:hypothetical protein [Microbacterium hydrothermale]|uniref:hypothetical protein n=1 Tax=Microbacterium hydrothermale TaxID=857427 RepID=UPI0010A81657|nr:hypothetical protein [Microbacterium hydrothermale]
MARAILLWLPVQLVLGGIQGVLPPSSPINREISGEESRFVQGGVVRITGTFTAPSGLTNYLIVAFAVLIAALVAGMFVRRSLAALLLLMAITTVAISGSRGAVLGVSLVLLSAVLHSALTRPGLTVRLTSTIALVAGASWLAATSFFPQVVKAFADRFAAADRVEDTGGRLLGQTLGFLSPENFSLFGSGVGGTSIVGIALGSGQSWVEIESIRWVVELGILGLLFASLRLLCGLGLIVAIFAFPWRFSPVFVALSAVIAPTLVFGTIGQNPSYQGSFAITLAMAILAIKCDPHRVKDRSDLSKSKLTKEHRRAS